MQIVDNRAAPQAKAILVLPTVACLLGLATLLMMRSVIAFSLFPLDFKFT
jgi:hypothetical protein